MLSEHSCFIAALLGNAVPVFKGEKLYILRGESKYRWQSWELSVLTPTASLWCFRTHISEVSWEPETLGLF